MRNESQTSMDPLSPVQEGAGMVKTCLWFLGADLLSLRFTWALQEQQMGKLMEKTGVCCLMSTPWPDGKLLHSALKLHLNGDGVRSWGKDQWEFFSRFYFLHQMGRIEHFSITFVCFPLPPFSRFLAWNRTGHHLVWYFQEYSIWAFPSWNLISPSGGS